MHIVHLSCNDIDGGAARGAWRIHDGVRQAGVESSMFVEVRDSRDPDVRQYQPASGPVGWLTRGLRKRLLQWKLTRASGCRPAGLDPFRDDRTVYGSDVATCVPTADIYHLHQITDFVDYRGSLRRLAVRAPIVWTLHELSPFTGGCHYAYDCPGFTRECGACPQLGSTDIHDLSHAIWKRKQGVLGRIAPRRLHVVGLSQWVATEARRSSLFGRFPLSIIPYGLDTDVFRPMRGARRLLDAFGLRPTTRVVLFVSHWTGLPGMRP